MNMLQAAWRQVGDEWLQNARLRLLLWVVIGISWGYALLVAQDSEAALKTDIAALQTRVAQARTVGAEGLWKQREQDAADTLQALRALSWPAQDASLAAAEAQDWLRALAAKTALNVQDLRVLAPEATAAGSAIERQQLNLRLSAEFALLPLGAFLQELGQAERGIVVERLQFKTWTRPASADLDLRIRLRGSEGAKP